MLWIVPKDIFRRQWKGSQLSALSHTACYLDTTLMKERPSERVMGKSHEDRRVVMSVADIKAEANDKDDVSSSNGSIDD